MAFCWDGWMKSSLSVNSLFNAPGNRTLYGLLALPSHTTSPLYSLLSIRRRRNTPASLPNGRIHHSSLPTEASNSLRAQNSRCIPERHFLFATLSLKCGRREVYQTNFPASLYRAQRCAGQRRPLLLPQTERQRASGPLPSATSWHVPSRIGREMLRQAIVTTPANFYHTQQCRLHGHISAGNCWWAVRGERRESRTDASPAQLGGLSNMRHHLHHRRQKPREMRKEPRISASKPLPRH